MKRVAVKRVDDDGWTTAHKFYHDPENTDKWDDPAAVTAAGFGDMVSGTDDVVWTGTGSYEAEGFDCYVEIPKFYYKREIDGVYWRWYISDTQHEGFKLHPAFSLDGGKDFFYHSAFEGWKDAADKMRSLPGKQPTTLTTYTNETAYCTANGAHLLHIYEVSAVQMLFTVEYATWSTQTALSEGITNLNSGTVNHSQNTGHTRPLGNASGEIELTSLANGATFVSGQTKTYPFSYRGIENVWGNVWKRIDGVIKKPGGVNGWKIAGTDHAIGCIQSGSVGYYSQIHNDDAWDFGFMVNNATDGATNQYFCDAMWSNTTNDTVPRVGGTWYDGSQAGGFCWRLNTLGSLSDRAIGARAAF